MHSLENTEGENILKNSLEQTQESILSITQILKSNKNKNTNINISRTPMADGLADSPPI